MNKFISPALPSELLDLCGCLEAEDNILSLVRAN
jgi:hypothetical protein